jgi:cell division control protein 7
MRACAALHGSVFETNIPTLGEKGFTFEKIVLWATDRPTKEEQGAGPGLESYETQAIKFMNLCFEWDPERRISAKDALQHPFLKELDIEVEEIAASEMEIGFC